MSDFLTIFLPIIFLMGIIIVNLLLEAFNFNPRYIAPITIIGSFLALVSVMLGMNQDVIHVFDLKNTSSLFDLTGSSGLFVIDNFYRFFAMIFLIVLLFVTASSIDYMHSERNLGVYYSLIVFATIGMILVAASNDLLTVFVAWELGSLPTYSLSAFQKSRPETSESALKFFLIGAMSSAFILFGISLVYGITGSTAINTVVSTFANVTNYSPLHIIALVFLFVGFGYKMAAVPFHAWAVDVYQGTPTTITTFLAAGSKAMGFAAVFRIVVAGLAEIDMIWGVFFIILAILTMTLGNVAALVQSNIKRMLAYSSIAHAGYILIAFAAIASESSPNLVGNLDFNIADFSIAAAELHILTHALMKIIAFTAVIIIAYSIGTEEINEYAGLRKKHPWLVFALSIALLSLLGVPPLGGFISKFLIFFAAIYANLAWLAIIGVINSAISVFYYVRVIKLMIIDKPIEEKEDELIVSVDKIAPYSIPWSYRLTIGLSTLMIIIIGILPAPFIDFAINAAKVLIGA